MSPAGKIEISLCREILPRRSSPRSEEWGTIPASGRYAYLDKITQPTLIVHGNKDIVVGQINALIAEHLPNAQLIVYSDSSHGTMYQHAKVFPEHVKLFLSEANSQLADPASISVRSSVASSK